MEQRSELKDGLSSEYFDSLIVLTALFNYNNKTPDDFAAILISFYPYLEVENSHNHLILRMLVTTARNISNVDNAHALIGCFLHASNMYSIESERVSLKQKYDMLMAKFVIDRITDDLRKKAIEIISNEIRTANHEIVELKNEFNNLPDDEEHAKKRGDIQKDIARLEKSISIYEVSDIFVYTSESTRHKLDQFKSEVFNKICTNIKAVEKKFPTEILKQINDELLSSEIAVECLRNSDRNGFCPDYSVALLPMMKCLEIILNAMFDKTDKTVFKNGLNKKGESFFNNRVIKQQLELGALAYLFSLDDTTCNNINDWWNKDNKIIDITLLRKFSDIELPTSDTDRRSFSDNDDSDNSDLLFKTLYYISQTFRNPTAHTSIMDEKAYNTCKELIISSQKLLWILMAVIC